MKWAGTRWGWPWRRVKWTTSFKRFVSARIQLCCCVILYDYYFDKTLNSTNWVTNAFSESSLFASFIMEETKNWENLSTKFNFGCQPNQRYMILYQRFNRAIFANQLVVSCQRWADLATRWRTSGRTLTRSRPVWRRSRGSTAPSYPPRRLMKVGVFISNHFVFTIFLFRNEARAWGLNVKY